MHLVWPCYISSTSHSISLLETSCRSENSFKCSKNGDLGEHVQGTEVCTYRLVSRIHMIRGVQRYNYIGWNPCTSWVMQKKLKIRLIFLVFWLSICVQIGQWSISLWIFDCSPCINVDSASTCHGLSIARLRSGFPCLVLELWPILALHDKLLEIFVILPWYSLMV